MEEKSMYENPIVLKRMGEIYAKAIARLICLILDTSSLELVFKKNLLLGLSPGIIQELVRIIEADESDIIIRITDTNTESENVGHRWMYACSAFELSTSGELTFIQSGTISQFEIPTLLEKATRLQIRHI
jgi:hypothetical protein